MKTPERTVEEIVGEHVGKIITACFHNDGTKKSVTDVIDKEVPLLIKRIKQAERQKRKEMVEAERERIEEEVLTPMYEEMHQWYVDKKDIIGQGALIEVFNKALQALTQPNNPK